MKRIRKHSKMIAVLLVSIQLLELIYPLYSYALTGGPSSPDVQQFQQAGNEQMVNLFSGDFNYSIPLLDVGGYPVSISYNSDAVKMETEAGCVGLGWNLDVGSISRDVRGLPDDFKGDVIAKEVNMRPEEEGGATIGFDVEVTGFSKADATRHTQAQAAAREGREGPEGEGSPLAMGGNIEIGISRSTYEGWEIDFGMSTEAKLSGKTGEFNLSGSLNKSFSLNNKSGAGYGFGAGFSGEYNKRRSKASGSLGLGLGLDVNTRDGIKSLEFSPSVKWQRKKNISGTRIRSGQSINFKFPVSFNSPSYSPAWEIARNTDAISWSLKLGGEVPLTHLSGTLKGHYSKTYFQQTKDSLPAYGYIYSQHSGSGRNVLDFNREKDRAFTAELPNLPVTQFTHDVYTVNGQGVGGSFRPFRGDCGTLHDPYSYQNSTAGSVGGEIGVGQLVKGGADFKIVYTHSESKKWEGGNTFNSQVSFKNAGTAAYEPVYFKNMGEATCMANPEQFDAIGGFRPIRAEVGNNGTTTNTLRFNGDEVFSGYNAENIQKRNREPRNTNFSFLTAEKAAHNGLDRGIKSYQPGSPVFADRDDVPTDMQPISYRRTSLYRKPHHISEVTVTRSDGARYVYGVPAYNILSADYTFNVSGIAAEPDDNKQISYASNPLVRSVFNRNGLDRYFEKEVTPAHPYAWMLSGVLSDDYVDLTGNGMSPDDLGNYTKINYQLTNSNYKWRTPYGRFMANFQENNKSDEEDNYASFTYGAKEIWNVHSIETRNLVAEFFYSHRKDGYAVLDVDGGLDVRSTLVKLDSVKLYSKSERLEKGDAAVPLKKVVLTYNYELCKGIPNASEPNTGKLTLAGIYFTYGTSEKGSLSPYQFTYSDENPGYKPKSVDKWGNYIKKEEGEEGGSYSVLPKEKADKYARAWLLTGIKTPEGSIINIFYESDDYAYVQNKTAMEMFTLRDLTDEAHKDNLPPAETPGQSNVYDGSGVYNYAKFKLKHPTADRAVLERYFSNINELFFTSQMDLAGDGSGFEKVDGFVPSTLTDFSHDYGFCTNGASGPYEYAWVKLPRLHGGDSNNEETNGVHPFAKTAWQKIRKSMPEMIYRDPSPMTDDPAAFAEALGNALQSIEGFYRDPNAILSNGHHAGLIKLSKSKIRLNSPDMIKFGGGARVKKITVTDEWERMSGMAGTTSTYGTEYFYTTKANINGTEMEISSGVNSYEPSTNADENPFSVPKRYTIEKPLSIDMSLYFTGPVGEVFFPGAGIGYSKVKVQNLQYENVTKNATGFSLHEFYTAKDFPTVTAQTDLQVNPKEVPFPPFYSEKQATVSQGFSVELNNMHGQQKAVHIFQETDSVNPISGQQFFYKTDARGNLNNWVSVVDPATGNVRYENFGVEYEMYADARESVGETYGPSAQVNADGFLAAWLPLFFPMVYPNMNFAFKRYCALTFTKVIHRSGVLDRVVSYNNGANASVSTTVFDKQTGEAVVTETENEFGKKEYALNIPAYWIYSGMDAAYKNQGLRTDITMPALGDYRSKFHVGDELLIHNYSSFVPEIIPGITGRTVAEPPKKAWVLSVNEVGLSLIDGRGNPITTAGNYSVEVLRSGRRNHLSESAGSVLSLTNPVVTSGSVRRLEIPTDNVINAAAGEYSDLWQTYAAFQATQPQYQCSCREFSNKIGTTSKSSLEQFLKTLMTRGDFSRTGVSLADAAYTPFGNFVNSVLGSRPRAYNGYEGATEFRGEVLNADSTNCHFTVEMADGTTLFPDSVIDFRIDLSLTDEIDRAACDNAYTALGIITYRGGFNTNTSHVPSSGSSTVTARVRVTTTCFPILNCTESYVGEGALTCAASGTGTVNPFVSDIMGCWRKKTDYAFRSERNITTVADGGVLNNFRSFFTGFPLMVKPATDRDRANWQPAGTATTYDPYGRNLESKNSLGIYSSEVFGYGFSLPVLAAQNSRYMNSAFDGFEDYQYKNAADNPWNDCPVTPHFRFDTSVAKIARDVSHTGYSSLKTSASVSLTRDFFPLADATFPTIAGGRFTANKNNLIQPFIPDTLNYFFSAWISKGVPGAASGGFGFIPISPPGGGSGSGLSGSNFLQNLGSNLGINVPQLTGGVGTILGGAGLLSTYDVVIKARTSSGGEITLVSANAEGKSVDGWRQINTTFKVPSNVQSLTVQLNANGKQTWFDDVRIQPFNSSMKTFVYDPNTLRLMAMLDENNFASMYEYDNEGNLVRTKKETEDNIVTLQEIRSAKPKTR